MGGLRKVAYLTASLVPIGMAKRNMYIYVDDWTSITPSQLADTFKELADNGATHIMNMVYMPGQGETRDSSGVWAQAPGSLKQDTMNYLHSKGSELMLVAAGGTLLYEQYINQNPQQWAATICGHAKDNLYDGVDFDLENLPSSAGSTFINFAKAATDECRKYVKHISHAPQSPYFESSWGNVYDQLVPHIDTLLVQYYNQGTSRHISYDTIFGSANASSVASLWKRFPDAKHKFVVGKFVQAAYGGSGMVSPSMLHQYTTRAEKEMGYTNGLMVWRAPQKFSEPGPYAEFLGHLKTLSEGASPNGGSDNGGGSVGGGSGSGGHEHTEGGSGGDSGNGGGAVGGNGYTECKEIFAKDTYCLSLCDYALNNPSTCSYYGISYIPDCLEYLVPNYCKVPETERDIAGQCKAGLQPTGNAVTDDYCKKYCDSLAHPEIYKVYCSQYGEYGLGNVKYCLRQTYGTWCSIM